MITPTTEQVRRYTESLTLHIAGVREAGTMLGVSEYQLGIHDASKWSDAEFIYYAMKFGGDEESQDKGLVADLFARAWLHHLQNNPHHWQHWIFPDGYTPKGSSIENGRMKMPNEYALEMIADWMGASKAYTGSFDISEWLHTNMPRIYLHSETADYVRCILDNQLGLADVAFMQRWGHESRPGERQL